MAQKCPKCETINPADSKFCKECATALPPGAKGQVSFTRTLETSADELARGTLFAGRYEIIEELGAGGMGKVYRAHDTKVNEEVALKLIKPEIAAERRVAERFRNELKMARKIRHKNVCGMYDFHEEGKTLYLTMEYVRGEDLKSLIHRTKTLSVGTALAVARQIAEGLGEAHKLGITHRDLKPGNVMIDKDGQAKIMDFGIARSLHGGGITAEGGIIGTPEYMSPEQVEGKAADPRADIYALGIILFEMVTGQVPFEGETPFSIANKQKSEAPPIPRKLAPQIPEGLNKLILRCLEKEREKRYQTTEELLADLATVEETLPTAERISAGRTSTRRRPTLSRKVTVEFTPRRVLIPAAILGLAAAGFFLWRFAFRPTPAAAFYITNKPSVAVLNFINRTGDPQWDNWKDVIPDMLITALGQSKYLYVLPTDSVNSVIKSLKLEAASSYTKQNLKDLGEGGQVKYVASGYYVKAGDTIRIQMTIQDARTGTVVGNEGVEGQGSSSFLRMIDELKQKAKPLLEIPAIDAANDIDGNMEKVTTPSVEAYDLLVQGKRCLADGNPRKAVELLEKAVAIDPEFASAYRRLAAAYNNIGRFPERDKSAAKALELSRRSTRITLREKLEIEGYSSPEPQKQIEALEKLLELYPEDWGAATNLGYVYANLENYGKTVAYFEMALRSGPKKLSSYGNLRWAYFLIGEYRKAEKMLREGLKNVSDNRGQAYIYGFLARLCATRGDYEKALAMVEKASGADPKVPVDQDEGGRICLLQGQFSQAEEKFRKIPDIYADYRMRYLANLYSTQGMLNKVREEYRQIWDLGKAQKRPEWIAEGRLGIIDVYDLRGETDAAGLELEAAWQDMVDVWGMESALYNKAWILARKKSFEEAQKAADEFTALLKKSLYFNEKSMKDPLLIQGRIELEKESPAKAVELLVQAKALLPKGQDDKAGDVALFLDSLALAYYRSNDLEKARLEYEGIARLTWGRTLVGGFRYARSFYMLGQIAEKQGRKAEARRRYREFLELWKNADPGLPEVEDAKKRLSGL